MRLQALTYVDRDTAPDDGRIDRLSSQHHCAPDVGQVSAFPSIVGHRCVRFMRINAAGKRNVASMHTRSTTCLGAVHLTPASRTHFSVANPERSSHEVDHPDRRGLYAHKLPARRPLAASSERAAHRDIAATNRPGVGAQEIHHRALHRPLYISLAISYTPS